MFSNRRHLTRNISTLALLSVCTAASTYGQDVELKKIAEFTGHPQGVDYLRWDARGTNVLSWSHDGTAQIWMPEAAEDAVVLVHGAPVLWADWALDGTQVLTVAADGLVRLFDAKDGQLLHSLQHPPSVRAWASWSPSGNQIVVGAWDEERGRHLRLWSPSRPEEDPRTLDRTGGLTLFDWHPEEDSFLTVSDDNTLRIWAFKDDEPTVAWSREIEGGITTAAWSRDGESIAIAHGILDHDNALIVIGPDQEEGVLDGENEGNVGDAGIVEIWSPGDDKPSWRFRASLNTPVGMLAWSADGIQLMTLPFGRPARLWKLDPERENDGKPIAAELQRDRGGPPKTSLDSLWISPCGRTAATPSMTAERRRQLIIEFWDTTDGSRQGTHSFDATMAEVVWSPDGSRVAILAHRDGEMELTIWQISFPAAPAMSRRPSMLMRIDRAIPTHSLFPNHRIPPP